MSAKIVCPKPCVNSTYLLHSTFIKTSPQCPVTSAYKVAVIGEFKSSYQINTVDALFFRTLRKTKISLRNWGIQETEGKMFRQKMTFGSSYKEFLQIVGFTVADAISVVGQTRQNLQWMYGKNRDLMLDNSRNFDILKFLWIANWRYWQKELTD